MNPFFNKTLWMGTLWTLFAGGWLFFATPLGDAGISAVVAMAVVAAGWAVVGKFQATDPTQGKLAARQNLERLLLAAKCGVRFVPQGFPSVISRLVKGDGH